MGLKNVMRDLEKYFEFKNEINWVTSIVLIWYHVFCVYWCWHYAFPVKLWTVCLYLMFAVACGIGITCGVHRLFSHRSYKVNTPLKLLLLACYSCAGQNSVYNWVRDHRLHHKFSDTDADPHNANRGLFFSHIGWLMMKKNEVVKKEGKNIDMSDITSDKILMLQHRYFTLFKLTFCYFIPLATNIYLGENWKCAIAWQWFIRYLHVLHSELSVNSFAHIYGYTPYNKNIEPKQNISVSYLALGEGWHNYHHIFPFDYKAAEFSDVVNISAVLIKWWAKMGWAYDLREANPEVVKTVIERHGDGSYIADAKHSYKNLKPVQ